jgi:hypothetical protein
MIYSGKENLRKNIRLSYFAVKPENSKNFTTKKRTRVRFFQE